tara:strand:- start:101 stop:709 length:609 start_codon:yes stop_codon:yes gene_type:complete
MTSKLIVNSVRHTGASADGITMAADGSVTFPGNATCSGTATGFGGISMAEIWRVNTEYTTNSGNTVYPTNWERDDSSASGHVGASGMSQSGGVFTFPSTGIYQITWQGYGRANINSGTSLAAHGIHPTTNNSSYTTHSIIYYTCPNLSTYNYAFGEVKAIIDVTDTSNVKVKLSTYSAQLMTWECNTNYNLNMATFIRLGDT